MEKKNILILCGGNSCRSQMAEGFLKFYACREANIYSAGLETKGIHPQAVAVMAEEGIDLRSHSCNHVDDYKNLHFDYVITVCELDERCPVFPQNTQQFHYNFPDPTQTAGAGADLDEAFRQVRNQIKTFAQNFVATHIPC